MAQKYDKNFKQDSVNYVTSLPDLSVAESARKLGIYENTLNGWLRKARQGEEFRGQDNYSSDEAKEIARLKRELKDTEDPLEILKIYKNTEE